MEQGVGQCSGSVSVLEAWSTFRWFPELPSPNSSIGNLYLRDQDNIFHVLKIQRNQVMPALLVESGYSGSCPGAKRFLEICSVFSIAFIESGL